MNISAITGWKLTAILLASAVGAFGQGYYRTPNPAEPPNGSQAQNTSSLEAGPGLITYVEGQASIDGQAIPLRPETAILKPGQVLDTSSNGFVEVLVGPAAFLRLGNNSEVRMIGTGLLGTKAELVRGKAMLEVDQLNDGTKVAIEMHGATAEIQKRGLYDFNMDQQAIKVLDGKATVTDAGGSVSIGRGHEVQLASAQPLKPRDFDQKAVRNDQLFAWSKARSKELMEANQQQYEANGGWYAPAWYWGGPYWNSFTLGFGYPYGPWGFYSPFYYGGYYVPLYVHPYRGGHRYYSQQELNDRVHNLFSGRGGVSRGGHSGHR